MFGRSPLSGVGLGNFGVVEPTYSTQNLDLTRVRYVVNDQQRAHNTYLEVAAEEGIAGVLLLLTVLCASIGYAGRSLAALPRARDALEPAARGLIAGAIGMFVACCSSRRSRRSSFGSSSPCSPRYPRSSGPVAKEGPADVR